MRRLLSILLLVLLPLQFSWAAVASYCEHEAGPDAAHVGHHAHQHDDAHSGEPGLDDNGGEPSVKAIDLDCAQCHGQCAALPLAAAWTAVEAAAERFADIANAPSDGQPSPRPERPQWRRLA